MNDFKPENITLREYFAVHAPPVPAGWGAVNGVPGYYPPRYPGTEEEREFAWRWAYADKMIALRTK